MQAWQGSVRMDKRASERIIIFIYTVYAVALMFASAVLGWPGWITPITSIGILTVWFAYLRTVRTYRFRALLYSAIVLATFMLYNTQEDSFGGILTTYCAAVVVLSMLDIPDIAVPEYIFSILLIVYHMFYSGTVPMATTQERIRSAIQILSAFSVVGVTHHLTKKRGATRQRLLQRIEELEAAGQSKLDFLSHVSHSFKAPADAVCSGSEMILHQRIPERIREEALRIQAAGRGLLSMADDVLDYAALESGALEIVQAPYHLPVVLNDVVNMALAYKGAKDLELIVDCSADIPNVLLGDEGMLRRVLRNLIGNAIKFTEAGGVTLMASARPEAYGVNLCVRIEDTGTGICEEQQEQLFNGFKQAEHAQEGLGLGLPISKKIITAMNGFISVRSKPGKGSEFQFVIPQKVVDSRPIAAVRNAESISVIFYINTEKESFNEIRDHYMRSIRHMLQGLGLRYRQCRNLGEMKRRVERERFTHVLITESEYLEDRAFFDQLGAQMRLILIQERESAFLPGAGVLSIHKPFYVSTLAAAFNGQHTARAADGEAFGRGRAFRAPEASVLVVDDNMLNLQAAEALLRPYGLRVATASSGQACLEKLESMHFDLIFMDHRMPGMDGVETAGRIRSMHGGRFKKTPIIALSANTAEGARERFLEEGFQAFVPKPIEIVQLENVLKAHIPKHKLIWEDAQPARGEAPGGKTRRIDREKGMGYMGGKAHLYENILDVYVSEGQETRAKLEKCYAEGDWRNYTILVHSLKSNSLSIGADGLGEAAKALEAAGRRGDEAYIREQHAAMMQLFAEVLAEIRRDKAERGAGAAGQARSTDEKGEGKR